MSKHQPVIGLHLGLHTEVGHRVLRGVLDYVDQHPSISLADFCFTEDTPVPPGAPPWTGKVDGMVMAVAYDRRMVGWVKNGGVPTVNASSDFMDTPIVSVFSSPESLAHKAVEHLHEIGYRSYLYVGVPKSDGSRRRRDAISAELKRYDCKLHSVDIVWEDLIGKPVDRRVVSALTRIKKPLAIVAYSDRFAVTIASLAQQMGFRIPEEVGILGVGDTAMARISSPPISTIRTAQERIGDEAARLVHRMIEGRHLASKNVAVPGEELIVPRVDGAQVPLERRDIQQALI